MQVALFDFCQLLFCSSGVESVHCLFNHDHFAAGAGISHFEELS